MNLFNRRWIVLTLLINLSIPAAMAQEREPLLVFGAASLTDALQKVSDAYTKSSGTPVKLSFAASSALAKQIESGARADVFMSADQEWMDYLQEKQLLKPATRQNLLGNRLVLIAPVESRVAIKLAANAPIAAALGATARLATGDPDSVPVGRYAKAALTSLGLWGSLESRLARAENVRVALTYVARGEAPLGIVYATDAAAEPRVRIVDVFPESSHPPITYPAALTKESRPAAASFLAFLRSDAAKSIFTATGFSVLEASPASAKSCTGYQFDVSDELKRFAGTARSIAAATSAASAPVLDPKQLYEVSLIDQASARFGVAPAKSTVNEGSYAGVLRIAANPSKSLRITLSQAAWIDVIDGNRDIDSLRHTGSHDCQLVRKSVEFAVQPGRALVVQLSGSTEKKLRISVSN